MVALLHIATRVKHMQGSTARDMSLAVSFGISAVTASLVSVYTCLHHFASLYINQLHCNATVVITCTGLCSAPFKDLMVEVYESK